MFKSLFTKNLALDHKTKTQCARFDISDAKHC